MTERASLHRGDFLGAEAAAQEYAEFLSKFEAKKTTDDCYTPDNIYEAVRDWAAEKYEIGNAAIVRPFYPGGDYKSEKYPSGCVVIDNPPFSIISEIFPGFSSSRFTNLSRWEISLINAIIGLLLSLCFTS